MIANKRVHYIRLGGRNVIKEGKSRLAPLRATLRDNFTTIVFGETLLGRLSLLLSHCQPDSQAFNSFKGKITHARSRTVYNCFPSSPNRIRDFEKSTSGMYFFQSLTTTRQSWRISRILIFMFPSKCILFDIYASCTFHSGLEYDIV